MPASRPTPAARSLRQSYTSTLNVFLLLLLLAALLAAASAVRQGIAHSWSLGGCGHDSPHQTVVLLVHSERQAYWNQEGPFTFEQVRQRISQFQDEGPQTLSVLLSSSNEARFGDVITLYDTVRLAGITHVQFETVYRALPR